MFRRTIEREAPTGRPKSGPIGRPGGSADDQFRQLRRAWRRNIRWVTLLFGIPGSACLIAAAYLGASGPPVWLATFGTASLALAIIGREWQPAAISNWEDGAAGERKTATSLRQLEEPEWLVLHDLIWPGTRRGNLDHVVVAGATIFVIDSKMWGGRLFISRGRLRKRSFDDARQPDHRVTDHDKVRAQAAALARHLRETVRVKTDVIPVMAVWTGFEERRFEQDGVTVLHGDELVEFLRSAAKSQFPVPDRIRDALLALGIT